jgi:hypothetical protein
VFKPEILNIKINITTTTNIVGSVFSADIFCAEISTGKYNVCGEVLT